MRYLTLFSIVLLLIPFLFGIDEANAATWYNSSWLKARKITIDQTDIDTADLTNYPLYVNVTQINIGTDTQADCDDFVFTDSTNVTKLDHEIETCVDASNWAEFWVEIPTVSFNADTVIYMYYDNAAATDQQNTQGTWNSNFKAVWHLNGTFNDSTSNAVTGTNSGTSAVTDEYIGDSRSWDGVNDYINAGIPAAINNIWAGGGTVSAWIKPTTSGESGLGRIAAKVVTTTGWYLTLLEDGTNSDGFFLIKGSTDGQWRTDGQVFPDTIQKLITIVYDSDSVLNNPTFYANGTVVSNTQIAVPVAITSDAANNLCLGQGSASTNCASSATFLGNIDEIRLNTIILAAEWIKADWECQKGAVSGQAGASCITIGSQGTEPPSGPTVTVSDEIAVEDSGTAYISTKTVSDDIPIEDTVSFSTMNTVTVSDDIPIEDTVSFSTMNTVTVSDDIPIEDLVSIVAPGQVTVSDEIAVEDLASLAAITVSDFIALEDSGSIGGTSTATRNAIAIYVNKSPFILGVFTDATRMTCNGSILGGIIFNTNDNMINICNGVNWTFYNGTIT